MTDSSKNWTISIPKPGWKTAAALVLATAFTVEANDAKYEFSRPNTIFGYINPLTAAEHTRDSINMQLNGTYSSVSRAVPVLRHLGLN